MAQIAPSPPLVSVDGVRYTYPGQPAPALRNADLRVSSGETLAIMGPTGAGKTSLVSLLNGLIPHFFEGELHGAVVVDGLSTAANSIQTLVQHVGLVLQDPETQLFGITVIEDACFGPSNLGLPRAQILAQVANALTTVGLRGFEDRLTAHLSGGEKQRLAIAGVLAMEPGILILDEPTSELDPRGREEIFDTLERIRRARGATVILVEHEAEDILRVADRVAVVVGGEVVWQGRPRDLFCDIDRVQKYSLRLPQIARLGRRLQAVGLFDAAELPLTVDEAEAALRRRLPARSLSHGLGTGRPAPPLEAEAVVEVRGLSHVYPGGILAVDEVHLTIQRGDFVAIVGQNGAGKTTLVKHFNGLLLPTSGSVVVDGVDTRLTPVQVLSRHVGYVFQNPDHQLFSATVEEELRFGLRNMGLSESEQAERIEQALAFVGLEYARSRHPFTLGKGERQKVAVASILAIAPPVIVIDEPTTGLDWADTERMMALIRSLHARGHTVLMITHNMEIVADFARRVILMNRGRVLLDGPPGEVFAHPEALEEAHLVAPPVARLAQRLGDLGIPPDVTTVKQMVALLSAFGASHV